MSSSTTPTPQTLSDNEALEVRVRGRRPGVSQGKRKASEELSSNPHSIKRRQREAGLSSLELQLEKVKAADRTAISNALKALKGRPAYQAADDATKTKMEEEKKDEVVAKRILQKRHHSVVEYELGMGEAGGLFARVDDGNPAWEDVEEEDETLAAIMARRDEAENGEVVEEVGEEELRAREHKLRAAGALDFERMAFRVWKRYWHGALRSLTRTLGELESKTMEDFRGPVFDPFTKRVYEYWQPHMFFSKSEVALLRNSWAWMGQTSSEWINLPGPAAFWPEGYNFEQFGFSVPPPEKAMLYRRAFEIAAFENVAPEDFGLVLPGGGELVMMEEGAGATSMIQSIYSLD